MKNRIRLTEGDLHRIVKESVNKVLESDGEITIETTSIEQSKRLIELGIDVNTADRYYHISPDDDIKGVYDIRDEHIYKYFNNVYDWNDSPYIPAWSLSALLKLTPSIGTIDAAFKMVCWTLENKVI